jgi:hypothetical protein
MKKAALSGLTHDRTRSHVQKVKIFLAQREASTHGFPPGIHPGQIVIPQVADLTHEFRHQVAGWLPPGFPGENASR